ncbi:MAG: family 10 glycosylhydrolase [Thermoguttaceae bacterium]|nr:family 10 glycosylhydrolase [Thermoguttaceae bacterium]MDW8039071.1 family 10 glycosylhydrolase [Thermoguttaceae bacterium]
MPGHGRPKICQWGVGWLGSCLIATLLGGSIPPSFLPAQEASTPNPTPEEPLKICVRIAWGGGPEQLWTGRIWVHPGTLTDPQPLGLEADEPGTFWIEQGQLYLACRTPRSFDGVDVWVEGGKEAKLGIELKPAGVTSNTSPPEGKTFHVALSRLLSEDFSAELDTEGTLLLVRRRPGDSLRITLPGDIAVFSPGQNLPVQIQLYQLPISPDTALVLEVQLSHRETSELVWSVRKEITASQKEPISLDVPLGQQEGVYELAVRLSGAGGSPWTLPLRASLGWKPLIAERRIQLVAISTHKPEPAEQTEGFSVVAEIDPANPRWFERFAKLPILPGLPKLWRGPLGNGRQDAWPHPLGTLCRLLPNPSPGDPSWEAYSLPIDRPGKPHLLEIRYPSDRAQTFSIRIVEPNSAGVVSPIGPEGGVHRSQELLSDAGPPRWLEHRMLFWPQTRTPMVLITNCRTDAPALYGRIRVLAGPDHLPAMPGAGSGRLGRKYYAYLHRPLFPRSFGAPEAADSPPERGLEDWKTFYVGATRLIETLRYGGYDGLVLPVLADGSSLYPSRLLQSSPRYDTGLLLESAPDPVRKDVLEMLFRLFDREGLSLVPMVEFVSPLPGLEARCRKEDPAATGIRWIGPEGKPWLELYPSQAGRAPYYNMLNEHVQQAMLEVIQELVSRYGHHRAMAGLAIQLSGWGYAQLLGPQWGLDDQTIARFQQETQIQLPIRGANRFEERAKLLTGPHRQKWLQWRAAQLSKFYQKVDRLLKNVRPEGRLYLLGGDLLAGPYWEAELRPVLGRRTSAAELLLEVGLDLQHYQHPEGPLLIRPEPYTTGGLQGRQVLYLEWAQLAEAEQAFTTMGQPGNLFVQHPEKMFLPSFDQRSPFRSPHLTLWVQPTPSDRQNRRRFVQSLASMDSQLMLDGGWFFPLGGLESLQDFIRSYRRLPSVRFQQLSEAALEQGGSLQPCVIRYAHHENDTYIYVVNPTPLSVLVRMKLDGRPKSRLEELSGSRAIPPLLVSSDGSIWTVELAAYDFLAVRVAESKLRPVHAETRVPATAVSKLEEHIRSLSSRAALLRNPPAWKTLANAGFEQPPAEEGTVPYWLTTRSPQTSIRVESRGAHQGDRCVRIYSEGPIACLVSRPFPAPPTGRFSMMVWLRMGEGPRQPPLRLAVEWEQNGRQYRYASVGASEEGSPAVSLSTQWVPYIFQVYDLPLDGQTPMRVRFDLMGAGEVWIDNVQISGLAFSREELIELSKLLTVASAKLDRGQLGDCLRILEGYWPRFLQTYVGTDAETLSRFAPLDSVPALGDSDRSSHVLDRLKHFLPRPLRF